MTPHLAGTPILHTDRLTLRAPGPQDWEAFCAFLMSERASFIRPPDQDLDRRKAWRAFGHVIGHWALRGFGQFVFCLKGSDTALGMTGPWFPEGWPEHELGWTVWDAATEGTGLAAEAAAATRGHAFRDLGWTTAVSYIDPANTRSIRLAERLGAVRDPDAATPNPDQPTLVYRHPRPTGPAA
jgi:RimJ/RimL family protein N-acetyltransferase